MKKTKGLKETGKNTKKNPICLFQKTTVVRLSLKKKRKRTCLSGYKTITNILSQLRCIKQDTDEKRVHM